MPVDKPQQFVGETAASAAVPTAIVKAGSKASVLATDPPPLRAAVAGRILLVDDTPLNLDTLAQLARDGHEVATVTGGAGALDVVQQGDVDLILFDLATAGMSGIEMLRRLRGDKKTERLPIIMVAAPDKVDRALRCIEAGANDYLLKPVHPTLLRVRIGAALDRHRLQHRDQEITQQLRAERQRSESLLRNLLPETIIDRLNVGESVIADHFESATILFCDLVGFTALSASLPPQATLELLNSVFSGFDRLAARHGVEKIKTIGDGYMVAGGLPKIRAGHARSVAEMALGMEKIVRQTSAKVGRRLDIRIGIHTGPVVAGIIGIHKFVYDVWGDTVNVASRMEHHSTPGRIHISAATREALGDQYRFADRPPIEIKGKGVMQTYFLEGRVWDHSIWPPLIAGE